MKRAKLHKADWLSIGKFPTNSDILLLNKDLKICFDINESNLKVIQSVMGHVDISTTMNIYAEVSEAKKKASMEALAEKMVLF